MPLDVNSIQPGTQSGSVRQATGAAAGTADPVSDGARSGSTTTDSFTRVSGTHGASRTVATSAPLPKALSDVVHARIRELVHTATFFTLDASDGLRPLSQRRPRLTQRILDVFDRLLPNLVRDPAHGSDIGSNALEEAAVGLVASLYGLIKGGMRREVTGLSEFIDRTERTWDVKSPMSPPAGATWRFNPLHVLAKVRHDLDQNDRTILNLTRCNPADAAEVTRLVAASLTATERDSVVILMKRDT